MQRNAASSLNEQSDQPRDTTIKRWLACVRNFDSEALVNELLGEWSRLTTLPFLQKRLAPFLRTIGDEWANGNLTVAQEHFASEHVRYELSNLWKPMSHWNVNGKKVVLATLPHERHDLGLHMAACVAAECGHRLFFLGADTPLGEIAETVRQTNAQQLLLSISSHGEPRHNTANLIALRKLLPATVDVLVGGGGAPATGERGIEIVQDLALAQQCLAA